MSPPVLKSVFSGQPKAVFLIFGMEFWERFSYYGFLSILVLWLTARPDAGGLGWENGPALLLVGYVVGAVWIAPILGGWVADRGLGARRAVLAGGVGLALGNALLAAAAFLPGCLMGPGASAAAAPLGLWRGHGGLTDSLVSAALGLGLLTMVVGAGLFKSNASALLSAQFGRDDPRRGPAFTLFYMGINLGALAAPLGAGTLGEAVGWGWGFAAAGAGMTAGVTMFVLLASRWLEQEHAVAEAVQTEAGTSNADRRGLWTVIGLVPFATVFWAGMLQYSGLLNLFTAERVGRVAFGWTIPATWFLGINPAVILLAGPLVAAFWTRMDARAGRDLFVVKVASALAAMAVAFAILFVAATSAGLDKVSPLALLGFWIIITLGELSLMPVGLALIGRIAPRRMVGMLMGVWLMTLGAGSVVAGWIGAWGETVGAVTAFGATSLAGVAASLLLLSLAVVLGRRPEARTAGA